LHWKEHGPQQHFPNCNRDATHAPLAETAR
jgi:hypothetical protein